MNKNIIIVAGKAESLINFRGHLLLELRDRGYSVIACAPYDKATAKKLIDLGIQFYPIPLNRAGLNPCSDIYLLYYLIRLFRKIKPVKVLSYTHKAVVYTSIAAKISSVPEIYSMITGLGYAFSDNGLKSKLVRYVAKKLFKTALQFNQMIFFQNTDNFKFFIENKLLKDSLKGVLINGSGVDLDVYQPTILPQSPFFLMIARLLIDKGAREYMAAATIVKEKYPFAKFSLVGGVEKNPNAITESELKILKGSNIVDYQGELEDVRPAISAAAIYVLPSYHEGTPRSVLEAMSMGRPIITTDAPGCRETVEEGVNGFLVPVKNVPKLVEAMEKFILHPELIAKMGKESRKIAEKKYDVHLVNKKILEVMEII